MGAADGGHVDWVAALAEMTLDEKAALTAGLDFWNLASVDRLGIPSIQVTDGPNGARGSALFGLGSETAVCVPCGSALGATWDPALVERVGVMLGEETHTKACRVLLAPTVNIHRSPIAGRNFECYSEDPFLSGKTAAAFVRGVQSQGIVTTVKHFAGNDAEFERQTINSVIDSRALREIYLVPFELAVREGGALGVMTAYNRLNGAFCSEHVELLAGILRGEWGFEGFVLTDWLSAGSTRGSSAAGVDLEMPGPGSFYGASLAEAVRAGDVDEAAVDAQVAHLLSVFDRVGALGDPPHRTSTSIDRPEHRVLAHEAAAAAMVLLKNEAVLPFDRSSVRTLAVIGPNAQRPQMMGGGSANLAPHYRISPLEALRAKFGDAVDVRFARGVDFDMTAPPIAAEFAAEFFAGREHAGAPVATRTFTDGRLLLVDTPPPGVDVEDFSFRAACRYVPDETGPHTLSSIQIGGRARVLVDGAVVLDGIADPPGPGGLYFGMGSAEVEAVVDLVAGDAVDVVVEFVEHAGFFMRGLQLGLRRPSPPDLLERAVATRAIGRCGGGRGGHQRRLGVGGSGSRDDGSPRRAGRAGGAGRGRQSQHGRRRQHRRAGDDALDRRRAGDPPGVVRRSGDGERARRRRGGRRRARRSAADDPAGAPGAQPVVRQLPRRERGAALRGRRARGVPVVRRPAPPDPVPVRPRALVLVVRDRCARGHGRR